MIYVSAGHHERAQGATWNGHTEWQETMEWRDRIVKASGGMDMIAVPTGTLGQKVAFINAGQPDLAIEVHFNSAVVNGKHVGKGCETLYYPGSKKGKILAQNMQDTMLKFFEPDRGIKEGWYRMDRPGVVDYHGDVDGDETIDYFLRKTKCPAVIIEPEFVHNIDLIQYHRVAACTEIAKALLNTLEALR